MLYIKRKNLVSELCIFFFFENLQELLRKNVCGKVRVYENVLLHRPFSLILFLIIRSCLYI